MPAFSQRLQNLLADKHAITIGELTEYFAGNGFAVSFLLLMALPALPLPTGGITHVFEIIVMLLALELITGRSKVWLPERWSSKPLSASLQTSALPRFIKIIQWIEKYSSSRFASIFTNSISTRIIGLVIFVFTAFAFLAPPFSGLDTLPSLGVVLVSLALIFEDFILLITGLAAGLTGITIIIVLGKMLFRLL